jgi:hypothetical protein
MIMPVITLKSTTSRGRPKIFSTVGSVCTARITKMATIGPRIKKRIKR